MDIAALLGDDASLLLDHQATAFPKELLIPPGPTFLDDVFTYSDRTPNVLRNLGTVYAHGRLGGTGYLSILPVDQGIEHSAAATLYAQSRVLRSRATVRPRHRRGLQCDCHDARQPRHCQSSVHPQDPLHRQAQPQRPLALSHDLRPAVLWLGAPGFDLGAVGVGATIYFGSEGSVHQIEEVRVAFEEAHRLGLFTVLWCYLRNEAFIKDGVDYEVSADLTGQGNHLGVTIEADIIKQKQPVNNGGYNAVKFGKTEPARLLRVNDRQPHRSHSLAGRQLLRGTHWPDQLRR